MHTWKVHEKVQRESRKRHGRPGFRANKKKYPSFIPSLRHFSFHAGFAQAPHLVRIIKGSLACNLRVIFWDGPSAGRRQRGANACDVFDFGWSREGLDWLLVQGPPVKAGDFANPPDRQVLSQRSCDRGWSYTGIPRSYSDLLECLFIHEAARHLVGTTDLHAHPTCHRDMKWKYAGGTPAASSLN